MNGGSNEIIRILNDHGISSKLSLRHLDLKSSNAKSLVEKLNYGQKLQVVTLPKATLCNSPCCTPRTYRLIFKFHLIIHGH